MRHARVPECRPRAQSVPCARASAPRATSEARRERENYDVCRYNCDKRGAHKARGQDETTLAALCDTRTTRADLHQPAHTNTTKSKNSNPLAKAGTQTIRPGPRPYHFGTLAARRGMLPRLTILTLTASGPSGQPLPHGSASPTGSPEPAGVPAGGESSHPPGRRTSAIRALTARRPAASGSAGRA